MLQMVKDISSEEGDSETDAQIGEYLSKYLEERRKLYERNEDEAEN